MSNTILFIFLHLDNLVYFLFILFVLSFPFFHPFEDYFPITLMWRAAIIVIFGFISGGLYGPAVLILFLSMPVIEFLNRDAIAHKKACLSRKILSWLEFLYRLFVRIISVVEARLLLHELNSLNTFKSFLILPLLFQWLTIIHDIYLAIHNLAH